MPPLNKKVIYLDQYVISNFVNPASQDPFWVELGDQLYRLSNMQLIVCPASEIHEMESLPSRCFEDLERMYELLSGGAKFFLPDEIRGIQLIEHARNWINGLPEKPIIPSIHDIVYGDINQWPQDYRVDFKVKHSSEEVMELFGRRDARAERLGEVFSQWQADKGRRFEDWLIEESEAFGKEIWKRYKLYQLDPGVLSGINPPPKPEREIDFLHSVFREFESAGLAGDEVVDKGCQYFQSESLTQVPFIKIQSMLFAALARKAASGQKRPPNKGMVYDIEAISLFLPYCDAMIVDKECHAYLQEQPLRDSLDYGTHVFSLNNKDDLLRYLREIEASAPKDHIEALIELYGDS